MVSEYKIYERYLRQLCGGIAVCLILCMSAAQASDEAAQNFFSYMTDIPVMSGLAEMPDEVVVFDKLQGRIVTQYALPLSAQLQMDEIADFYKNTLPHLGWKYVQNHRFLREDERLDITFIKNQSADMPYKVQFTVQPQ